MLKMKIETGANNNEKEERLRMKIRRCRGEEFNTNLKGQKNL
jgi:hypothetical protein